MTGYMQKVRNLAIKYPTKEELEEQFKIEMTKAIEKQKELTKQGKKDYSVVMFSKMYDLALKMNEQNLTSNDEISDQVSKAIAMAFDEVNRVVSSTEELAKVENQRTPMSVLVSKVFSTSLEKNLVSDNEVIKEHFVQVLDMYTWIANVFVQQIVGSKAAAVSTGEIMSFSEAQFKITQYLQSTAYQQGINILIQKLAANQFSLMRIIPDPEKGPMTREEFMQLLTGK
jgi:hypothetical protein